MKILVTGGLGFIGHQVVSMLESQGNKVAILDNETTYGIIPQDEISALIKERKKAIKTDSIYFCDIADADVNLAFEMFKPDIVIHLASFPRQKVVNSNPTLGSRTMSEGLLNLLEASARHQVKRFAYVSSSMVYGDFKDQGFDGITEYHECNPKGQYGIMKLAGEWLVKDYARRYNMQYVIVRPSAVYGPLDVEDRVVSKFFLSAMRGEPLQVNGSTESLDFTYVSDTADAIATASLHPQACDSTYNISRGRSRTLLEAANLVVSIVGQGTIKINDPDNNFPSRGQLNNMAAYSDFGYSPTIDIEQGFKEYYEWLKDSIYGIKKAV